MFCVILSMQKNEKFSTRIRIGRVVQFSGGIIAVITVMYNQDAIMENYQVPFSALPLFLLAGIVFYIGKKITGEKSNKRG